MLTKWQRRQAAECGCRGSDDLCPCQNVDRSAVVTADPRQVIAKVIYARRPFCMAETTTPLDRSMTISRSFEWDAAPAFYQEDCFDLADVVIAGLTASGLKVR